MSIDGYLDSAHARRLCSPTTPTSTGSTPCGRLRRDPGRRGHRPQRQPAAAGPLEGPPRRAGRPAGFASPIKVTVTERAELDPARGLLHHRRHARSSSTARAGAVADARSRLGRWRPWSTAATRRHAPDQRGPRRPRRAAADGRGRRHGAHPVPDRRPGRRAAAGRRTVLRRRSRARRFVSDGRFPWNPDRRAMLAEVRQIGDVVLLRYALSPRFRTD